MSACRVLPSETLAARVWPRRIHLKSPHGRCGGRCGFGSTWTAQAVLRHSWGPLAGLLGDRWSEVGVRAVCVRDAYTAKSEYAVMVVQAGCGHHVRTAEAFIMTSVPERGRPDYRDARRVCLLDSDQLLARGNRAADLQNVITRSRVSAAGSPSTSASASTYGFWVGTSCRMNRCSVTPDCSLRSLQGRPYPSHTKKRIIAIFQGSVPVLRQESARA